MQAEPDNGPESASTPDPWADGLSAAQKAELMPMLPKKWPDELKAKFLANCGECVSTVRILSPAAAVGPMIEGLELVADRAHALKLAINSLQPDAKFEFEAGAEWQALADKLNEAQGSYAQMVAKAAMLGGGAFAQLQHRVYLRGYNHKTHHLADALDVVTRLEQRARKTLGDLDYGDKTAPSIRRGRELVCLIANSHRQIIGKLPPASCGQWFCQFMAQLGEKAGFKTGEKLTRTVVQHMADSS